MGRGRVTAAADLRGSLARAGAAPVVIADGVALAGNILGRHRALADGSDVWHLHDRSSVAQRFTAPLWVAGRRAEVRDVDTDRAAAPAATATDRGAPADATMTTLAPLDQSATPGIRYLPGVATDKIGFGATSLARPSAVDPGKAGDVAKVRVDGVVIGTAWHAPYRRSLGAAAHRGVNTLEVRLADLVHDRLLGDAQPDATRVAFVVVPTDRPDAPLRLAGPIGPAAIVAP